MSAEVAIATLLIRVTCSECAITFGLPEGMHQKRVVDGQTFYCPNGHRQHFAESENERLKKRVAWAEAESARQAHSASLARFAQQLAEAQRNRLKRRVSSGTCPRCRHTIPDLKRHMAAKHPDYAKAKK